MLPSSAVSRPHMETDNKENSCGEGGQRKEVDEQETGFEEKKGKKAEREGQKG